MSTAIHSKKQAGSAGQPALSFHARYAAALRTALPAELKAHGAELPTADIDVMAESLARRLTALAMEPAGERVAKAQAKPPSEWISTQEAADRCGFSRPFVAALLDSGSYPGKVTRTPGGHRKVLASEFEALVAQASAQAPQTMPQARKAVDLLEPGHAEPAPSPQRRQSRVRAQALAKKLGITV